jgi:hypothetical protein
MHLPIYWKFNSARPSFVAGARAIAILARQPEPVSGWSLALRLVRQFGPARITARISPLPLVRLACVLTFTFVNAVCADSTNLAAMADTTLQEAFPDNNFGGGTTLTAGGRAQGGRTRALLQFDIAGSIPPNATISSAALTIVVTAVNSINASNSTFNLHRVVASWGEGNGSDFGSGSLAVAGEATWNHRLSPDTAWTGAGGDFAAASAGQAVSGLGAYTFNSPALATDVQAWLDNPAGNFGWLLRSEGETIASTIRRFASRLDTVNPPRLLVNYTLSATPLTPLITNVALLGDQLHFSFSAEANHTYTVETRSSLTGGTWNVLTNIPAFPSTRIIQIANTTAASEGYFRVSTQ